MVVAFQGERGAHSEDAVIRLFGEVETLPCRTLREVFEAVQGGQAEYGLVPVENSWAGSINETWDLLLEYNLHITAEVDHRVSHTLQALPGQRLEDIKTVYSHPQALSQCQEFLRRLGAELMAVHDTAGSARLIKERGLRGAGAIASRRAAEIYGLEILAEEIEDDPENTTKFYALSRRKAPRGEKNRTALVMATQHRPGALYWCLGAFAYRQVNLVKLESRPSRRMPWDYIFYLVFDGHADDPACAEALAELRTKTTFLRVLGSYPVDP
jgi:prephenate dehydratase